MNKYTFDYQTEIINGGHCSEVDVPVLLLFFNRPTQLQKVFEKVRAARPSKLFLYQDGKRDNNEKDAENVEKCRQIVSNENIDWDCTVYRMYQTRNYGCDPSEYMCCKWAFSIVDKCVILEDDDVPSVSFLKFCKEMLERYEDDKRIYRISGYNPLGKHDPYDSDYFFTRGGSIWGWASWKRVIDEWDPNYEFLSDEKIVNCYKYTYKNAAVPCDRFIQTCERHKATGKEFYESIFSACRYMGSGLTIVPSKNMISNIGVASESTHSVADIKLINKSMQKCFNSPTYEIDFPIKHPKYVLEDKKYEDLQSKALGWRKNIFGKLAFYIERVWRKLLYGRGK